VATILFPEGKRVDRNFALALGLSFLVLMLWTMFNESTRPPDSVPVSPPGEEELADRDGQGSMDPDPVFSGMTSRDQVAEVEDASIVELMRSSAPTVVACFTGG
jgi:hypothetical protein